MGRMYTATFTDVAVTAAQDLWQIEANTAQIAICGIFFGQATDYGDAAAEGLEIRIRRVTDALTNVTAEVALDPNDAASLADINVNDTTQLTTGATNIHAEVWNIQLPFVYLPPPDMRPLVEIGNVITVGLMDAPTDSITMSGTLYFKEIGG